MPHTNDSERDENLGLVPSLFLALPTRISDIEILDTIGVHQNESSGRIIFTADEYALSGRRFTVLSDEKLRALLEFEGAIRAAALGCTAWSDDLCPKSLVEETMRLRDQP